MNKKENPPCISARGDSHQVRGKSGIGSNTQLSSNCSFSSIYWRMYPRSSHSSQPPR